MKKLLALVIVCALAAWGYYIFFCNGQPFDLATFLRKLPDFEEFVNPTPVNGQNITFRTSDGFTLRGAWYPPQKNTPAPIIILIHQYQTSHHDFDGFVPYLLEWGYAVLAYDSRSTVNIPSLPKDVPAAVSFAQKQSGVNPARIGLIGSSVGANIAFVAAGAIPQVKAVVLLSPGVSGVRGQVQNGSPFTPPANVFILTDENEWAEANLVHEHAGDPKDQKLYQGAGHGVKILQNEAARRDIFDFLLQKI